MCLQIVKNIIVLMVLLLNWGFVVITRGTASSEKGDLVFRWKECMEILKDRVGSIVLPMGSLAVGLCRHRALLFKVSCITFLIVSHNA